MAPLSPSNHCTDCHQQFSEVVVVCSVCNKLQPYPSVPPSFFDLFGLAPALELDEAPLRQKYYDLSQKTHPDTQSQTDPLTQLHASKWSTYINKAFQTLKTTQPRLEYLLDTYPNKKIAPSPPPTRLAEAYFELQEMLLEGPNQEAIQKFLLILKEEESRNESHWRELASCWKTTPQKETLLPRVKDYLDTHKYLNSLKTDLNKKRGAL